MKNSNRIERIKKMAKNKGMYSEIKELSDEKIQVEIERLERKLGITALRNENQRLKEELEELIHDKQQTDI